MEVPPSLDATPPQFTVSVWEVADRRDTTPLLTSGTPARMKLARGLSIP